MAEVFQVKFVKATKLRPEAVQQEILKALQAEGKTVEKEYEKTVASWKGKKPRFTSTIDVAADSAAVLTGPTGDAEAVEKWRRLDEGVPPDGKIIVPVNPGVTALRFQGGPYQAKTQPRVIGSRGGGPSGAYVFRKWARHLPNGIEAREWSAEIQKRRRRRFTQRMIGALNRGLKKARGR